MLDRGVWYRDAAGTGNLPGAATRRGGLDLPLRIDRHYGGRFHSLARPTETGLNPNPDTTTRCVYCLYNIPSNCAGRWGIVNAS